MISHTVEGSDPVCVSIEMLLQNIEADGKGQLIRSDMDGAVCLRFGSLRVEAESYDIALVRLASAMMDDARYLDVFMGAVRDAMLAHG